MPPGTPLLFSGTPWATRGGDHAATASATTVVTSVVNDPYTWLSTPLLVSDVQAWLNAPATTFGWEFINLDEITATDFRSFYTRESTDAPLRPQLQITFTPAAAAPEPTTGLLLPVGMLAFALKTRMRK